MNKVLIVLGMHRSGTSLVSSWLNKCGLNLGDHCLGGDKFNKEGHFEDLDFLHLHEEVLSYYKIIRTGLIPPFNFKLSEDYYKKLTDNIKFKNSQHRQWGWKEPRTCLFLDFYQEAIPDAKYVIVYRNYQFVVESLCRREFNILNSKYNALDKKEQKLHYEYFEERVKEIQMATQVYLSTWIRYNKNLLKLMNSVDKNNYVIVKYDRLVENDKTVFEKLKEWKFKLKYIPFSSIFDTAQMNQSLPDIVFPPEMERKAIDVYDEMSRLLKKNEK